jgi:uncharacterized protein YkwD
MFRRTRLLAAALVASSLGALAAEPAGGVGAGPEPAVVELPELTPAPEVPLTSAQITASRNYVINLTNIQRAQRGLPRLIWNAPLINACHAHANDMARMQRMTHTGSDGSNGGTRARRYGFSWSAWGENVAAGYTSSNAVVTAWMNSPGHRANMLSRSFTHIGVSLQRGNNNVIYFCMLLARH